MSCGRCRAFKAKQSLLSPVATIFRVSNPLQRLSMASRTSEERREMIPNTMIAGMSHQRKAVLEFTHITRPVQRIAWSKLKTPHRPLQYVLIYFTKSIW
jgi:hypothetical protein